MTPPLLKVLDRESHTIGHVRARIGLLTYAGPVTRFTEKTIWTQGKSGSEWPHRFYDGNVPGVHRNRVREDEFIPLAGAA